MTYVKKLDRRDLALRSGSRAALSQLDIELTERCNNACLHCCVNLPEGDGDALGREMSTAFVKEVLTEAAALGCLTIRFTGGEPLLRGDLPELYLFARRLGMQVVLFTNARLVTREFTALLAKVPPGRKVEVSVYGMRPETCDRVTGRKGAFGEFRQGVEMLLRCRIPFIVKGPRLPMLEAEREEFEAWAGSIPSMGGRRPAVSMNFDLRHRRDDPAKNRRIARLRATPEETVAMLVRNPLYQEEMRQYCSKFMGPSGDRLFHCGAGCSPCVDAYGRAQLCLPLRDGRTVVDLHETTLRRAVEERFPQILETRAAAPEYLRRCARCFLKGLCDQCPAKSWGEHGTLDRPVEYLCSVAHARARHLGLLDDREQGWEVMNWKQRVDRLAVGRPPAPRSSAGTNRGPAIRQSGER